jgi:hypothetical protein
MEQLAFRMEQLAFQWTYFHEILYWIIFFENACSENSSFVKIWQE